MEKSFGEWGYAACYKGENTEMWTAKLVTVLEGKHLESFVRDYNIQALSGLFFRYKTENSSDIDAKLKTIRSSLMTPLIFMLSSYKRRIEILLTFDPKHVFAGDYINKISLIFGSYISECDETELLTLIKNGHHLYLGNHDYRVFFLVYKAASNMGRVMDFLKEVNSASKKMSITHYWSRKGVHGCVKAAQNLMIFNSELRNITELNDFFNQ